MSQSPILEIALAEAARFQLAAPICISTSSIQNRRKWLVKQEISKCEIFTMRPYAFQTHETPEETPCIALRVSTTSREFLAIHS